MRKSLIDGLVHRVLGFGIDGFSCDVGGIHDKVPVMLNSQARTRTATLDLPVMDYYAVQNLMEPDRTCFQNYSGRVSTDLKAFGWGAGTRIPLAPLP